MARILYVIRPSKGGAFAHVRQLSSALGARGHKVAVAGPHRERASDLEAEVIEVDMGREISAAADARAIAAVGGAIRRFQPDLIHAHGSKGGVMARLARAVRPRVPLVFTPHQYAFANYFAGRGERLAYLAVERALAPFATRVIGVCEAERELAARIGPRRRTRLVYNGIDPLPRVEPSPELAELRARGPVVLAVAELQERKGLLTLIESVRLIRERHPEAIVAVAGDGPDADGLRAASDALGLQRAVRFLGHVHDIPATLAAADVFVNPAWAEAFPYSVLEAMSIGLPIVATDVGGTAEAIRPGETGLIVPPHDPERLAAAVCRLLAAPDLAGSLGSAAAATVPERFSREQMISGVLEVYAEVGVG